jgi:hypothetical protein
VWSFVALTHCKAVGKGGIEVLKWGLDLREMAGRWIVPIGNPAQLRGGRVEAQVLLQGIRLFTELIEVISVIEIDGSRSLLS